ncbi:MAG: exodeoxyribonuclease V subunit alpha [Acidimicrobiales bacterium]
MTNRPNVPDRLRAFGPFVDAGLLGNTELQATAALARLAPETPCDVLLAYAFAVRAPLWGHVCVDLATIAIAPPVDDPTVVLPWPEPSDWQQSIESSPLVRPLSADNAHSLLRRRPLAIEGSRVYLDRYARYEQLVAHQLRRRTGPPRSVDDALLNQFFPDDPDDKQRQAARVALASNLAVIAGGPGTGKTRTVARLLAAMLSDAASTGAMLSVGLAAPTGKAASRMTEAIRGELNDLDLIPEVYRTLSTIEATTIHRLLGPAGDNRFLHDRQNPLPHDVVVVDESSMVSLPLMARLLDALRADARVVLVGDPYQLASVEAGAVLGDLIDSSDLPDSIVRAHTVALDRVHRFGADSGIAHLAGAIRRGDVDAALAVIDDPAYPDAVLVDPADHDAIAHLLELTGAAATAVIDAAKRGDDAQALLAASAVKVLAATREGPLGVQWWADQIFARSADSLARSDLYNPWYVGRPLLVTQNDPVQRVFNGDVGVVVDHHDVRSLALADQGAGGVRYLPVVRLRAVETWWSMTIHKSQGSEFPAVIVSLPSVPSPIMSRELLYTGVTRAKERVVIVASRRSLAGAINRRVERTSGLTGLLQ